MNVEELRSQTRTVLEQTLNQLQAATLLVAELESQVSEAGKTVQHLSQIIDQFIHEQSETSLEIESNEGIQETRSNSEPDSTDSRSDE